MADLSPKQNTVPGGRNERGEVKITTLDQFGKAEFPSQAGHRADSVRFAEALRTLSTWSDFVGARSEFDREQLRLVAEVPRIRLDLGLCKLRGAHANVELYCSRRAVDDSEEYVVNLLRRQVPVRSVELTSWALTHGDVIRGVPSGQQQGILMYQGAVVGAFLAGGEVPKSARPTDPRSDLIGVTSDPSTAALADNSPLMVAWFVHRLFGNKDGCTAFIPYTLGSNFSVSEDFGGGVGDWPRSLRRGVSVELREPSTGERSIDLHLDPVGGDLNLCLPDQLQGRTIARFRNRLDAFPFIHGLAQSYNHFS